MLPSVPLWELVLRGLVVYAALLVALRLFGKREVGQFTLFDLVFVLLVANALQPAMTGQDYSLTGGLVLIVALVAANFLVGRLDRIPMLRRVLESQPSVLIRDGKVVAAALKRENLTEEEVEMAIREHGIADASGVRAAYLEPDGTISVIPIEVQALRGRRRVKRVRQFRRGTG